MFRVCILKSTGKMIESQEGGDDANNKDLTAARLGTLTRNALNAGYKETDIEAKWVTGAEYKELTAPTAEEIKERENVAIKATLREIDIASIRPMREWMAKQTDAPQFIKDKESQAQTERTKLK